MASILTKVMSSGASRPQLRLPEELLAPAESKGPGSPYLLMKKNVWRAVIEVGFIIFLFYSNLLMGEFIQSGAAQGKGLWWALRNIFSATNFLIAVASGLVGYIVFEFLRNKLQ